MDDRKWGGVPWAPPFLEEGRPVAVSRISNPDRQNSAIDSFSVVDRDLDFMITECAIRNMKRRDERLKDQSIAATVFTRLFAATPISCAWVSRPDSNEK